MIKSMTGYGKGEDSNKDIIINVSMSALNSRFFDCKVKMPRSLNDYEEEIIQKIKTQCKRGRIIVNIDLSLQGTSKSIAKLNEEKLNQYLDIVDIIKEKIDNNDKLSIEGLLSLPDIISIESALNEDILEKILINSVKFALDDLENMRKIEGANLGVDLIKRIKSLSNLLDKIEIRVQETKKGNIEIYRKKLKSLVKEVSLDENRLLQEIVIQAEKKDITEEIIRLRSHFDLFDDILKNEDSAGKKMNFLHQEMVREVNTVGSKTIDIEISHIVVSMKEELEKIKEQLQNIL